MNLFAYGTLMWPEVLETVAGRRLEGVPARLEGFRRLRVAGEPYPAMVASPGDAVEGVLYSGLTAQEFSRLDRFEGREYDRVPVRLNGGADAMAYVLSDDWRHIAGTQMWHPQELTAPQLARFVAEYKGWADLAAE